MAQVARDEGRVRVSRRRGDHRPAGGEPEAGGRAAPASRQGTEPEARGRAPASREGGERDRRDVPRQADDPAGSSRSIAAPTAARAGLRQIVELTAKEPEGVTSVRPAENGWVVGVEVVVERRIPSSADLLALYEAQLDPDGALTSYRRMRRYSRGRGGNDEES